VNGTGALPLSTKAQIAARIGGTFLLVHWRLRRDPLPRVVESFAGRDRGGISRVEARRLSRIVYGTLRLGPLRPRCLVNALVLFRLLRAQGDEAELVIGLPRDARDHEAHAWVEVERIDVGPPPGKGSHEELARYR
jgi:Transglutaminase-like superfamily